MTNISSPQSDVSDQPAQATGQVVTKNRRGGRPRAENPRSITVSGMITAEEKRVFDAQILKAGLSKSEAVRLLVIHETLPTKIYAGINSETAQMYTALAPVASNLNQLAKHLNERPVGEGLYAGEILTVQKNLDFVRRFLEAVRRNMLAERAEIKRS